MILGGEGWWGVGIGFGFGESWEGFCFEVMEEVKERVVTGMYEDAVETGVSQESSQRTSYLLSDNSQVSDPGYAARVSQVVSGLDVSNLGDGSEEEMSTEMRFGSLMTQEERGVNLGDVSLLDRTPRNDEEMFGIAHEPEEEKEETDQGQIGEDQEEDVIRSEPMADAGPVDNQDVSIVERTLDDRVEMAKDLTHSETRKEEQGAPLEKELSFRSKMAKFKFTDETTLPSYKPGKKPPAKPVEQVTEPEETAKETTVEDAEEAIGDPTEVADEVEPDEDEATEVRDVEVKDNAVTEIEGSKDGQKENVDPIVVEPDTQETIVKSMDEEKVGKAKETPEVVKEPTKRELWLKKEYDMDPRPKVLPRKVREIPDWVEPDLYGRGYRAIFGKGAEARNAAEAKEMMEKIRKSRFVVRENDHVDYDLYGRADPRIFGLGSDIASKEQALSASRAKQKASAASRKNGKIVFIPGDRRLQDKEVPLIQEYVPPPPVKEPEVEEEEVEIAEEEIADAGIADADAAETSGADAVANPDILEAAAEEAEEKGMEDATENSISEVEQVADDTAIEIEETTAKREIAVPLPAEPKKVVARPPETHFSSALAGKLSMFEQKDQEASEWRNQRQSVLKQKHEFEALGTRRLAKGEVVREGSRGSGDIEEIDFTAPANREFGYEEDAGEANTTDEVEDGGDAEYIKEEPEEDDERYVDEEDADEMGADDNDDHEDFEEEDVDEEDEGEDVEDEDEEDEEVEQDKRLVAA